MFDCVIRFLKEVRQEMGKVIWPTKEQAVRLTLITVIVAAVVSICVAVLDYSFGSLIGILVK